MATQQMDAFVLPCDGAAESDVPTETVRSTFQAGGSIAGAMHAPSFAHAEFADAHDSTGTAVGSEEASLNFGVSDECNAVSNDLADLYSCFSAYCDGGKYHEFVQEEDARRASCRWPLLVESRGVSTWANEDGWSC